MPSYSGEFLVPRSPGEVYDFLLDPENLVKCVPGVQRYEIKDEDHYAATLQVGVARIQASLTMNLEIVDKSREAGYAKILGSGTMLGSAVKVEGSFTLVEVSCESTLVKWAGEAKLGARLVGIIGHFLEPLVKDNIQHFVSAVEAGMVGGE